MPRRDGTRRRRRHSTTTTTRVARRAREMGDVAPRISLARLVDGDDDVARAERGKLADALTNARGVGWFELDARASTSTSASTSTLDATRDDAVRTFDVNATYDAARAFFSLPDRTKCLYVHTQYASESGGYVPTLEEYSYRRNTAALVESFDVVRELDPDAIEAIRDERGDDAARGLGPVDWPVEVPRMRTAFKAHYAACDAAARILFREFARALGLDDDEFLRHFGVTAHCSMRAMRYPSASPTDAEAGLKGRKRSKRGAVETVGISEHTDFEFFTILHQTVEGLELKRRDGTWCLAPAYPSEPIFTVILSDAFEIFTNGVVRATPHRVRPSQNGTDRLSLVRFNGLNDDAVVAPLSQFITRKNPKNRAYAPRTQGDHVGESVTRASDNLAEMIQNATYPKTELTKPPKRFAQLLIVDASTRRILLGKHTRGEFEGRYTGFIAPVEPEEDFLPVDVARTKALSNANLNPVACDLLREDDLAERGRFVFDGWTEGPAVEHEFVAVFRKTQDVETLFVETDAPGDVIPTWFDINAIPYDDMPDDDAKWYPSCLAAALDSSRHKLLVGRFSFGDDGALEDYETREMEYAHPKISNVRRVLARRDRANQ